MLRLLIILFALLNLSAAVASNLRFLESAPIADFTSADTKLFEEAVQSALNNKKDGEKLTWKNEKSGNSGLVNPLSTFTEKGLQCRNLRIVNRSSTKIAETKFKFCKKEGKWLVVGSTK